MNSVDTYSKTAIGCSKTVTETYSTSFASAIRLLHPDLRGSIHSIYGFVRFADEIVDTFHQYNKAGLLERFRRDTFEAIDAGISLNPVLHSFQLTVKHFNIDHSLIHSFFQSMETDLHKQHYRSSAELEAYIYGSAEVVGLMCLYVFCEGNRILYKTLEPMARSLGAAFQKVNFLRDLSDDLEGLKRSYFPDFDIRQFNDCTKKNIEKDIMNDFQLAYDGIRRLPLKARFGVYVAYRYYFSLFKKIRRLDPCIVIQQRIRIPNYSKAMILVRAGIKRQLNLI